jgi:hypothetical protein
MATGTILLLPNAAVMPDGTASNLAPAMQRVKSSGTAPGVYLLQLAFDAAADEWCTWSFRCPADYASGPIVKIQYKMTSATTGAVVWDARLGTQGTGASTSLNAKVFASANTATPTVPATTAGKIGESSITMTNDDSMAVGDFAVLRVSRVGSSGSDTATGDAELIAVVLEYTTT